MDQNASSGGLKNMHYSVVIPIKNEEENILELIAELEPVMQGLNQPWELICVDDGSTDRSLAILRALCQKKPYMKVLSFTKNFGQSAAFAAGFKAALGKIVITMDGDGQNDPHDIPKLVDALKECDLSTGWRVKRKDNWQKTLTSKISNWVRSRMCKDGMHDSGCSLKAYKREALSTIKLYRGMHRFLPALFKIEGFKVMEIPVNHRKRIKGATKYHFFNRSLGPLIDMFVVCWMRKRKIHSEIKHEIFHRK